MFSWLVIGLLMNMISTLMTPPLFCAWVILFLCGVIYFLAESFKDEAESFKLWWLNTYKKRLRHFFWAESNILWRSHFILRRSHWNTGDSTPKKNDSAHFPYDSDATLYDSARNINDSVHFSMTPPQSELLTQAKKGYLLQKSHKMSLKHIFCAGVIFFCGGVIFFLCLRHFTKWLRPNF